jgi:hypothetical protein
VPQRVSWSDQPSCPRMVSRGDTRKCKRVKRRLKEPLPRAGDSSCPRYSRTIDGRADMRLLILVGAPPIGAFIYTFFR